jgi:hypothetical protein
MAGRAISTAVKFTAILAEAAWRQADAILRNEAKIIGSKPPV